MEDRTEIERVVSETLDKPKRKYAKKDQKADTPVRRSGVPAGKVKGDVVDQVITMLHLFCARCDDRERGALLDLAKFFDGANGNGNKS